jgi:hypothetical protein
MTPEPQLGGQNDRDRIRLLRLQAEDVGLKWPPRQTGKPDRVHSHSLFSAYSGKREQLPRGARIFLLAKKRPKNPKNSDRKESLWRGAWLVYNWL